MRGIGAAYRPSSPCSWAACGSCRAPAFVTIEPIACVAGCETLGGAVRPNGPSPAPSPSPPGGPPLVHPLPPPALDPHSPTRSAATIYPLGPRSQSRSRSPPPHSRARGSPQGLAPARQVTCSSLWTPHTSPLIACVPTHALPTPPHARLSSLQLSPTPSSCNALHPPPPSTALHLHLHRLSTSTPLSRLQPSHLPRPPPPATSPSRTPPPSVANHSTICIRCLDGTHATINRQKFMILR